MTAAHVEVLDRAEGVCRDWEVTLLCWQCGAPLAELTPDTRTGSGIRTCQRCKMTTQYRNGIWRALSPDRVDHFRKFIAEYELIRAAEGRGSAQPEYYLNLPFKDMSGRNGDQWAIRARTLRAMQRSIVAPLARRAGCALRILDLGAGNGWLSYRLALQGHFPIAVDLLTNIATVSGRPSTITRTSIPCSLASRRNSIGFHSSHRSSTSLSSTRRFTTL